MISWCIIIDNEHFWRIEFCIFKFAIVYWPAIRKLIRLLANERIFLSAYDNCVNLKSWIFKGQDFKSRGKEICDQWRVASIWIIPLEWKQWFPLYKESHSAYNSGSGSTLSSPFEREREREKEWNRAWNMWFSHCPYRTHPNRGIPQWSWERVSPEGGRYRWGGLMVGFLSCLIPRARHDQRVERER